MPLSQAVAAAAGSRTAFGLPVVVPTAAPI